MSEFLTPKSFRKQGEILNIGLSSTLPSQVLAFVRDSISHKHKFFVTTPNSEIVLAAQKDRILASALNLADIALPDGFGLLLASKLLGIGRLNQIKGRKMFLDLVKLANKKHWKIFLLGGKEGEAKAAAEILARGLKGVKIEFAAGPVLDSSGNPLGNVNERLEEETLLRINKFAPQLLFVGFGAPKQEKWTVKWLSRLNIGGAMVVGGTFNYISGRAALPPKWMDIYGLEWLWRLITQPWRAGRVFRAVVIFPLKVFWSRFRL